jgi:hypothetical protein
MNASSPDRPRRRRWRAWALALVALAAAVAALLEVTVSGPVISVRWREELRDSVRQELERRYSLVAGAQQTATTWRYRLADRSRENVAALVRDPVVEDTHDVDRDAMTVGRPSIDVGLRPLPFPFSTDRDFPDLRQLFQIQSLCAILAALALLFSANQSESRRRWIAVGVLGFFVATAFAFPLDPAALHMGDSALYVGDRGTFESYMGVRAIRFEAHLAYAIAGRLYALAGPGTDAPVEAMALLMRLGTGWFALWAFALGYIERWSPQLMRYLGLVLLAPSALLLFGYRELGHLSLNLAAFPLLLRGLRAGSPHLEVAAVLAGLGAALHGFGLLALAGGVLAACVAPVPLGARLRHTLTVGVWGTAAYVGWIAIYVIVLELPISGGHTEAIPWRPWLIDRAAEGRINVAILSATGARDLLFTTWVVGAPLAAVAASLWRRFGDDVRMALVYSLPSVLFSIAFWPVQGLGVEMDLVAAAFPAFYALAWVCAHEGRRGLIAAALLASAHVAFWRIVLDDRFTN